MSETDPIRQTDDEARTLAKSLVADARHGALAVLIDGQPFVSRVALAPTDTGLLTLVSDLAPHTTALRNAPQASLLVGEPGKGDPLAHPRITLQVTATFIEKSDANAQAYLACQPKAQLYIGFGDFHLVRLAQTSASLNGGFGKAYALTEGDLA